MSTPAAAVTPGGAAPGKRPIGSGPFVVDGSDVAGVRLVGQRRLLRRPRLSAVAARCAPSPARSDEAGSYEVGSIQVARHALAALDATGPRRAAVTVDGPQALTGFVAVGRIADADVVRRVLALAINRERLRRLTVREPAAVVKARYDPARAKSEVERRWGASRPKLALLVDASRFDDRDVAERILADLARAGVDAQRRRRRRGDLPGARRRRPLRAPARHRRAAGARRGARRARPRRRRRSRPPRAPRCNARAGAAVDLDATRVVPLYVRAARLYAAPELRDLAVDGAGRAAWADAHWLSH